MNSQLDDVNELLKLKQGDLVRLMHIKKTLESRNVLYISDAKYLQELTKAYLEDHTGERFSKYNSYDYPEYSNKLKDKTPSEPTKPVKETKSEKNLFCGNCGHSIGDENFCPKCGHSLKENKTKTKEPEPEKSEPQLEPEEPVFVEKKIVQKNKGTKIGKIPIIILGVLAITIIAGAAVMNSDMISMDTGNEKTSVNDESKTIPVDSQSVSDSNSKCGAGTVFDDKTNSCVLVGTTSEDDSNSKCGAGTVFDDKTNSCVLENSQSVSDSNSKCGAGTVFDDKTNSCILAGTQSSSNSKCGPGTVFDDVTNSCVLG